jgi:hypothetical protein
MACDEDRHPYRVDGRDGEQQLEHKPYKIKVYVTNWKRATAFGKTTGSGCLPRSFSRCWPGSGDVCGKEKLVSLVSPSDSATPEAHDESHTLAVTVSRRRGRLVLADRAMTGAARRLRAVLAAVLIQADEPELSMVHKWLDSWRGVGLLAVGFHRTGYDLDLRQYGDGQRPGRRAASAHSMT